MKDITLLTHLQGLGTPPARPAAAASGPGFGEILADTITKVNAAQIHADRQVEELHSGQAKNLHEVMISMEQADISLRLMVQMRNKVSEAYHEVMRMQV
ncbi:flagellar hook-basal body complex protein FliE [Geoalkalibacter halelectricus]|uniref:Flagellar hook-basal body complex protein FliE n=1 Tax=Geoalkalibacter halelectricus TaxID=2847045 RepID=A0ABY5ZKV1_9BACT|nr:flagellar hook-basal body complex protein FliE [Geoalkalibacter halelectricus]MDO3378082.1 flagellar hook-basal body complex protein FliE [Geoalkalibacter halelectricus]UWZ78379.1 flagellar hook-basal body complex protein FliE [Geoalkalibacter halelectricus]